MMSCWLLKYQENAKWMEQNNLILITQFLEFNHFQNGNNWISQIDMLINLNVSHSVFCEFNTLNNVPKKILTKLIKVNR